jgi:hypothetical protein
LNQKNYVAQQLNLSTSYNLDADGVTSLGHRSELAVEHNYLTKNECEFGATLDPYAIDNLETG